MCIRKTLFFIFLFFWCNHNFALGVDTIPQEKYTSNFAGLGYKQQKVSSLSPLYYSGLTLAYTKSTVTLHKNKITSSYDDVFITFGQNKKNENRMFAISNLYAFNSHYLLNRNSEKNATKYFVGWGYNFDVEIDLKTGSMTNNPVYLHLNNLACFTVAIQHKINEKTYIFDEFCLPLAGIYFGSDYGVASPLLLEEGKKWFDMFDFLTIADNFQFQNKLNVDFELNTKKGIRTLRLQYTLAAKHFNLNHIEVHNIGHFFTVGYLFNVVTTPYVHN